MTDKVIENINKKLEGNIDDLDGLETLKCILSIKS